MARDFQYRICLFFCSFAFLNLSKFTIKFLILMSRWLQPLQFPDSTLRFCSFWSISLGSVLSGDAFCILWNIKIWCYRIENHNLSEDISYRVLCVDLHSIDVDQFNSIWPLNSNRFWFHFQSRLSNRLLNSTWLSAAHIDYKLLLLIMINGLKEWKFCVKHTTRAVEYC